jgi:hypothetical protein
MTRFALLLLAPWLLVSCGRESAPEAEREQAQAAAPVAPSATPAPAGGPEADPASCVTYDNAYASAPLMRVRGAADSQVRFQDRAEACPATGSCDWRRDGYVIGGDVVLASAEVNGFRCVYAGTAKGDLAAGFLPATELEPVSDAAPAEPQAFEGRWRHLGENEIVFTRSGGALTARGQATYDTGVPGGVNTGEFEGPVTLQDGTVRYAGEGCTVSARLRGPFLVVEDKNGCGGLNVSFGGVYTRVSA